jgi:hypothetical protein
MIIDWGDKIRGAAVISSYAAPLLEGCGTIKKGDLRVVGETEPVPFVAAFATDLLNEVEQAELQRALYEAGKEPGMLTALETMLGFAPEDFKPVGINLPALRRPSAPGRGEGAQPPRRSRTQLRATTALQDYRWRGPAG